MRLAGTVQVGAWLAAALTLTLAPAASAATDSAGGLKYVTENARLKGHETVTATAACPSGRRVIGGGERTNAGINAVRLGQTFPYDGGDQGRKPDDGWRVRAINGSSFAQKLKITAVCGDLKVSYRKHKFDVPATNQRDDEVSCPNGTFALSGGVEAGKKTMMYLNSTFPSEGTGATAWGGYVDNVGPATEATTHVVCGKAKPTIVEDTLDAIPTSTQGTLEVACPNGRLPYGGGQANNAGFGGILTSTLGPLQADGWVATIDKNAGYQVDMTVSAICGKPLN